MSSIPTETPVWILSNPPVGEIQSDTFKQTVRPIPELQDGQVLVKLDYFSNEPAQRTWMDGNTDPVCFCLLQTLCVKLKPSIYLAPLIRSPNQEG